MFINLKLINGIDGLPEGSITINTANITSVYKHDSYIRVGTKLGFRHFRISKEEYEEKVKHLFQKDTIEISTLGTVFVKDIEGFWKTEISYEKYGLQMSWTDKEVTIRKSDYDKLVLLSEKLNLLQSTDDVQDLLWSGKLDNVPHSIVRDILYWQTAYDEQILIKDFEQQHLLNTIEYVTKRGSGYVEWIKVFNDELEYRKKNSE